MATGESDQSAPGPPVSTTLSSAPHMVFSPPTLERKRASVTCTTGRRNPKNGDATAGREPDQTMRGPGRDAKNPAPVRERNTPERARARAERAPASFFWARTPARSGVAAPDGPETRGAGASPRPPADGPRGARTGQRARAVAQQQEPRSAAAGDPPPARRLLDVQPAGAGSRGRRPEGTDDDGRDDAGGVRDGPDGHRDDDCAVHGAVAGAGDPLRRAGAARRPPVRGGRQAVRDGRKSKPRALRDGRKGKPRAARRDGRQVDGALRGHGPSVRDDREAEPGDPRGRLRPQRPVRRPLPPSARRTGAQGGQSGPAPAAG